MHNIKEQKQRQGQKLRGNVCFKVYLHNCGRSPKVKLSEPARCKHDLNLLQLNCGELCDNQQLLNTNLQLD